MAPLSTLSASLHYNVSRGDQIPLHDKKHEKGMKKNNSNVALFLLKDTSVAIMKSL